MSQREKPRLALNNITAGVREREDANRTREAGCMDEIQRVVASSLKLYCNWAVGFIDWLNLTWSVSPISAENEFRNATEHDRPNNCYVTNPFPSGRPKW